VQILGRRFVQAGVLIFVTIALALSAQATGFNKASLKGSYSFLTNRWTANVTTNQFAMVGIMTFDGAGNVTGSYTSTAGGVVQTQSNLWTADVKQVEDSGVSINVLDGKGNYKFTETDVLGGKLEKETSTGTYTVNQDGSFSLLTANGTKWACVLNSVTAGQAKGAQCLVIELNGNSLGNIAITGIALKQ
jgi:hypothetical protein